MNSQGYKVKENESLPFHGKGNNMTLKLKRTQHCWMLLVASVCTPCCMLLRVVAQSLKPVKLFSRQLQTFLLFRDRRSVAQQCQIRLHSSSNIVGATHAYYAWFTDLWVLSFPHALQVSTFLAGPNIDTTANTHASTPNIFGATMLGVVASVCTQP